MADTITMRWEKWLKTLKTRALKPTVVHVTELDPTDGRTVLSEIEYPDDKIEVGDAPMCGIVSAFYEGKPQPLTFRFPHTARSTSPTDSGPTVQINNVAVRAMLDAVRADTSVLVSEIERTIERKDRELNFQQERIHNLERELDALRKTSTDERIVKANNENTQALAQKALVAVTQVTDAVKVAYERPAQAYALAQALKGIIGSFEKMSPAAQAEFVAADPENQQRLRLVIGFIQLMDSRFPNGPVEIPVAISMASQVLG